MEELFRISDFSSKNDGTRDFEIENLSSKKNSCKKSYPQTDKAWDDGSVFPSSKNWKVGDRIGTANRGGTITQSSKNKVSILWDNQYAGEYTHKEIEEYGYKFLEENSAKNCEVGVSQGCGTSDRWNPADFGDVPRRADGDQLTIFYDDSHEPPDPDDFANLEAYEKAWKQWKLLNLISVQGLASDIALPVRDLDLNSSEPQKLTLTALTSSASASQECITMEVSGSFQDVQREGLDICVLEESISSPLPRPAPHFQQKGNDLGQMTSATASPQSLQLLENCSPSSQSLKTSLVCSPAPIAQVMSEATSDTFWKSFSCSGTMRNGLLLEAVTVPLPSLEKEFCWLPSPGALSSTGKGRPPGQTKQEGELKRLGAIAPKQVVNPEFLESAYNLPLGWTDPQENRSASELLAEMESLENAAQHLATHLTPELQRSHLIESSTSISVQNQQRIKAITLHQPWAYLVGRSKHFETRSWATNYRGKIAIHASTLCQNNAAYFLLEDLLPLKKDLIFGAVVAIAEITDCILIMQEFINQQSDTELRCGNWRPGCYAWKLENIQILSEPIAAKGKQGLWDVELTLSEATLENFLEETEPQPEAVPKEKGRQRKGCLYKYIENKKLKDGTVASYPRVVGHRDPSNPTHWRWGFNWEEKVDGEWKNRSLSVKLGAIPLVQSMQKEGISLEEIIGFLRRSKGKG